MAYCVNKEIKEYMYNMIFFKNMFCVYICVRGQEEKEQNLKMIWRIGYISNLNGGIRYHRYDI